MSIFLPILEVLLVGYLAAVGVQFVLLFLVSRMGQTALMNGDCFSRTYYTMLAITWVLAAAVSGYVAAAMAPYETHGTYLVCLGAAALLAAMILRNRSRREQAQPLVVTLVLIMCIFVGSVAGIAVRLHHPS